VRRGLGARPVLQTTQPTGTSPSSCVWIASEVTLYTWWLVFIEIFCRENTFSAYLAREASNMERILGATSYTVMRWYFASDGYSFKRSSDKRSCNSAENSIPVAISRLANLVIDGTG